MAPSARPLALARVVEILGGAAALKTAQSAARTVYSHLYQVFPMVVDKVNSLVVLIDAVNRHTRFIITGPLLQNGQPNCERQLRNFVKFHPN